MLSSRTLYAHNYHLFYKIILLIPQYPQYGPSDTKLLTNTDTSSYATWTSYNELHPHITFILNSSYLVVTCFSNFTYILQVHFPFQSFSLIYNCFPFSEKKTSVKIQKVILVFLMSSIVHLFYHLLSSTSTGLVFSLDGLCPEVNVQNYFVFLWRVLSVLHTQVSKIFPKTYDSVSPFWIFIVFLIFAIKGCILSLLPVFLSPLLLRA